MSTIYKYIRKIYLEKRYEIIFLFFIMLHIIGWTIFQYLHIELPTFDSAGHLALSRNISLGISELSQGNFDILGLLKKSPYYPPLLQTIGAIILLGTNDVLGFGIEYLLVISLIFFLASVFLLYKIILYFTKNKLYGFSIAIVFSLIPALYVESRVFHLDLPLLTLLLLSIYFFIKCNNFGNRRYVIFCFITIAFSQLVKWYAFVYLIIPSVYAILNLIYLKSGEKKYGSRLKNIFIGIIFFLIVSTPWYYVNWDTIISGALFFGKGESDDPQNLLSIHNFTYYFRSIYEFQVLFYPSIMILLGLIYNIYRGNKRIFRYLFVLLFPLLVFTFIPNKNIRYILPLTPMFAVLIYDGVLLLGRVISKSFILLVTIIYMSGSYIFLSFNQIEPKSEILRNIGYILCGPSWYLIYDMPENYTYVGDKRPVEDMINDIIQHSKKNQGYAAILLLSDKQDLSLAMMSLITQEVRYSVNFSIRVTVPSFKLTLFENERELKEWLDKNEINYILTTTDVPYDSQINRDMIYQLKGYINEKKSDYGIVSEYIGPRGLEAQIFYIR